MSLSLIKIPSLQLRPFPNRLQPLLQLLSVNSIVPIIKQDLTVEFNEFPNLLKQLCWDLAVNNITVMNCNGGCLTTRIKTILRINSDLDPWRVPSEAFGGNEDGMDNACGLLAIRDHLFKQFPLC